MISDGQNPNSYGPLPEERIRLMHMAKRYVDEEIAVPKFLQEKTGGGYNSLKVNGVDTYLKKLNDPYR